MPGTCEAYSISEEERTLVFTLEATAEGPLRHLPPLRRRDGGVDLYFLLCEETDVSSAVLLLQFKKGDLVPDPESLKLADLSQRGARLVKRLFIGDSYELLVRGDEEVRLEFRHNVVKH